MPAGDDARWPAPAAEGARQDPWAPPPQAEMQAILQGHAPRRRAASGRQDGRRQWPQRRGGRKFTAAPGAELPPHKGLEAIAPRGESLAGQKADQFVPTREAPCRWPSLVSLDPVSVIIAVASYFTGWVIRRVHVHVRRAGRRGRRGGRVFHRLDDSSCARSRTPRPPGSPSASRRSQPLRSRFPVRERR